ncbi:hypothetical protein RCL_jg9809.t1 [Rhizophagus clarus]|uniref:Uncharacterized protein n=1 Tax=Rhizophagus clarus TaxID=94130 RepID=A0A8H3QXF2_9GLOM|nr:hypothetical protein RCL_jg9809.t1 [Rhizophagus clarus]
MINHYPPRRKTLHPPAPLIDGPNVTFYNPKSTKKIKEMKSKKKKRKLIYNTTRLVPNWMPCRNLLYFGIPQTVRNISFQQIQLYKEWCSMPRDSK